VRHAEKNQQFKTFNEKDMKNKILLILSLSLTILNTSAQDIQKPELLNAAKYGDTIRIRELVQKGADINIKDKSNNYSPLMWASIKGNFDAAKLLIENGAELNCLGEYNNSALALAAFAGRIEIVKLLVLKGAEINPENPKYTSPLNSAVNEGHTEVARFLIDNGAVIQPDILSQALQYPDNANPEIIYLLILNGANVNAISSKTFGGTTALIWAVKNNYLDLVKFILEKKPDVNIQNKNQSTALLVATEYSLNEMAVLLISNGADINTFSSRGSALMIASALRNRGLVELLIESGADVNFTPNHYETAFIISVKKNDLEIAKLLIKNGANLDVKSLNGATALMIAVAFCHTEIVKLLIENKADLNVINNNGETALSNTNCAEAYNLLKEAGAR